MVRTLKVALDVCSDPVDQGATAITYEFKMTRLGGKDELSVFISFRDKSGIRQSVEIERRVRYRRPPGSRPAGSPGD